MLRALTARLCRECSSVPFPKAPAPSQLGNIGQNEQLASKWQNQLKTVQELKLLIYFPTPMMKTPTATSQSKRQDIYDRILAFAQTARVLVRRVPKSIANMGDCRRMIVSSGAIGSAFIDADQTSNQQEFAQSIANCCREARHAKHWAYMLDANLDPGCQQLQQQLLHEAEELESLFKSLLEEPKQK